MAPDFNHPDKPELTIVDTQSFEDCENIPIHRLGQIATKCTIIIHMGLEK
jgi:hypothetical protein